MITEYQIENFKAFGSPQTLPIRPITLIFGPNSSGKSSIFQSLLMLKQTIEQADNPETTLLFNGDLVDLGSFRELINHHDLGKSFSFKIMMPRPKYLEQFIDTEKLNLINLSDEYNELQKKLSDINSIGMNINFSYDQDVSDIFVSEIAIFIGEETEPLITYEPDPNAGMYFHEFARWWLEEEYRKLPKLILIEKEINTSHKYFDFIKDKLKKEPKTEIDNILSSLKKLSREKLENLIKELSKLKPETRPDSESHFKDALSLKNFFPDTLNSYELLIIISSYAQDQTADISLLALAIPTLIKGFLENILYIGPQRENPERYYAFSGNQTRYVGKSGKFVPDLLITDKELKGRVNKWFNSLEIGYELKISSLTDPITEIHDLFALRLCDKNGVHVGLTDVGFGLSQVLPVIVQSVVSQGKTILIEQPEYHLHPRLQAELGDMFIESALGEQKNTFLIETHSEHLILRIMRRMRETFEGRLPEGKLPVKPEDVAVVYVEKDGDQSIIREMPLNERGDLLKAWPGGFFEESFREVMA